MLSMSPSKRRDTDMMKLMMSDFEVHIPDESSMHDFLVAFPGPEDTPYQGGVWKVHVTLPKEYPFKSPSIGFENRMFHPNVDEMSGSVCLDVINQTWSPMFDLVNIFKLFIPQLLSYPNPTDPLNGEAAALLMRDPEAYASRIRECVRLHASDPVHLDGTPVVTPVITPLVTSGASASASGSSSSGGGGGSSSSSGSSSGSSSSGSSSSGSRSSVDSDSSSDEKAAAAATNEADANNSSNNGGGVSGGSVSRNDKKQGEGDSDVAMEEDGGDGEGADKRRDSVGDNSNNGGNSSRSSSSSDFMMEMDMDETASDVSLLSDVDG